MPCTYLQVAVQHAHGVRVREPARELHEPAHQLALGQLLLAGAHSIPPAPGEQRGKVAARGVLHQDAHARARARLGEPRVVAHDVLVVHARERVGLGADGGGGQLALGSKLRALQYVLAAARHARCAMP